MSAEKSCIILPMLHRLYTDYTKIFKPDGNCYFRAIAFAVSGASNQHVKVRNAVVHYIEKSGIIHSGHTSKSGKDYIKNSRMNQDGVPATKFEIEATSLMLKCAIYVWHKSENGICCWGAYNNSAKEDETSIYLNCLETNIFKVVSGVRPT